MTLAAAKEMPLMGQPGSWNGYAKRPIGDAPDGVLTHARAFFAKILKSDATATNTERMQEQVAAITLVLADRESNSPQGSLNLETRTDDDMLQHITAPDTIDGLPF